MNCAGREDETYHKALDYIHQKTRAEGIDSALQHVSSSGEAFEFDALLLCDRKGVGQQLAAQAGTALSQASFSLVLIATDLQKDILSFASRLVWMNLVFLSAYLSSTAHGKKRS